MKNVFLVYLREISIEFQEPFILRTAYVFRFSAIHICTVCTQYANQFIRSKYTKHIREHKHTYTHTTPDVCAHPSHVNQLTHTHTHSDRPTHFVWYWFIAFVCVYVLYTDCVCAACIGPVCMLLYVRDEYEQRTIRHSFGYETIRGCPLESYTRS